MRLLLCSDPLAPSSPDTAFDAEVQAIERLGLPFDLLDIDSLLAGSVDRAVRRVREDAGLVVYRGWMVPIDRYRDLAAALMGRGAVLINSPDAYVATHYLPAAYGAITAITPATVWIEGTGPVHFEAIHAALASFGHRPIVVKDYVKSRKHEWDEACFIPAADDRVAVERVVGRFVELQGEDLAGGLVFREFVDLEPVGRHPQSGLTLGREYRLYFLDERLLIAGRYWDDVDYSDEFPVAPFERLARSIGSRFFSMDIAKTAAGDWIVMEVGDGQVSGLPDSIAPADFYARLATRLA